MLYKSLLRSSFLLAVICSILSQLPFLLQTITGNILKSFWIFPFILNFLFYPQLLFAKPIKHFHVFMAIFFIYCLVVNAFTCTDYIGIDMNNIFISLIIFVTSYATWANVGSQKFLNAIVFCSLLPTCIVAYYIYKDFLSTSVISEKIYAYASKNSAAQIILNAVIICYCINSKRKWIIALLTITAIALISEIFILKARATMVGLLFVILYFAFTSRNKVMRRYIWGSVVLVIIYCICNYNIFEGLFLNLVVNQNDITDLDSISSGRLTLINSVWGQFKASPLLGIGNLYIDCFPVAILAQYGIVGAAIIVFFLQKQFRQVLKNLKLSSKLHTISFILFTTILINALFEAQPPFGPGMKCFMVWMAMGFSFADCHMKQRV